MQGKGKPEEIAHFVNQLVFCFFASSVKLLPDRFFPKLLKLANETPEQSKQVFDDLFSAMEKGGRFGLDKIAWFNGGLFDGRRALPLDSGDIGLLQAAASLDWSQIDPSIFGTLFERFLDPQKRRQIGAHYTNAEKIMLIVEPVILRPLREEWATAKVEIEDFLRGKVKPPKGTKRRPPMSSEQTAAEEVRARFIERLKKVSILDPACGSGNFLYLALQGVKDIENRANLESEALGLPPRVNEVGPEILHGIEINPVAAELARTAIWIGDIQWRRRNGIYYDPPPILRKLDTIECRDALIERAASAIVGEDYGEEKSHAEWREAEWPRAEFIVGNPPFLGTKKIIGELGEEEAARIRKVYRSRVSPFSDLVCWWFEKARAQILAGKGKRAGLVATNSIRGGKNRLVLDHISRDLTIFDAWSDEPWIVEGAAVRVSLVCFTGVGGASERFLDGKTVLNINRDLTVASAQPNDLTKACRLNENEGVGFVGTVKAGKFDVPGQVARDWLSAPANPNGRRNSDVLRPWFNTLDVVRRPRDSWVVDFGDSISEATASLFQSPYEHVRTHVKPLRDQVRRKRYREYWWLFAEPCMGMRRSVARLGRYIATPTVAKHRVLVWLDSRIQPDHQLVAIARDDDTSFGILHSRFHEAWSLRLGTWLGVGNDPRYTPTTTFETFPFPEGLTPNIPAADYADDPRAIAIADAAKRLDELRSAWLNPPDLVTIEPEVVPGYPDRILPKDAEAAVALKNRTLTKLYNERPQWLDDAHRDLDAAVAAAYGWPADISEEDALAKLLELNLQRAATEQASALTSVRGKADNLGGGRSKAPKSSRGRPGGTKSTIIGREAFAKISAVEGIVMSEDAKKAFAEFDRQKLSPVERRRAIVARFKREAAE